MAVPSTMLPLGTEAPDFALPDPDGTVHRLEDFADAPGLLVMFICNHCPYVKHLQSRLAEVTADLVERGVAVVAIQPNDVEQYPDDRPERMAEEARAFGYPPVPVRRVPGGHPGVQRGLHSGPVPLRRRPAARLSGPVRRLAPGNGQPITGADLVAAAEAVLAGQAPSADQYPSVGCSIKWKTGGEPG